MSRFVLVGLTLCSVPMGTYADDASRIASLLLDGPQYIEVRAESDAKRLLANLLEIASHDDASIEAGLRAAQARVTNEAADDHKLRAWDWNFKLLMLLMFESERGPYRLWKIPRERFFPTKAFAAKMRDPSTEVEYSLPLQVNENGKLEIVLYHSGNFTGNPAEWDFVQEFENCRRTMPRRVIDLEKQGQLSRPTDKSSG